MSKKGKSVVVLGPAEERCAAAIEGAVAHLRAVAAALADEALDGAGASEEADAFFAACETVFDPDAEPADLALLLEAGGRPAEVLRAFNAEHVLLGQPFQSAGSEGHETILGVEDLDEISQILDEIDRLDLRSRVQRYLKDDTALAFAVGIHLARDGANELFPLEAWVSVMMRRCLAAAAITAASLAATALTVQEEASESGDPEPEETHFHRHDDLDGLIHTAAAAVDALGEDEREDLSGGGFGAVSHFVEDILYAAADLEAPAIRHLSARLVAAFLHAFAGDPPVTEIVESEDESIVRILAGADLAGRLAAERLAPESEPDSPFQMPRPLIH